MTATLAAPRTAVPGPDRVDAARTIAAARGATRRRARLATAGLAGAVLLAFGLSLSLGAYRVPLGDVVGTLVGHGRPDTDFIVRTLRLPRALTGVLVGAAFGMAGATFQSLARNPLASPDVIGITQGAAAAAVFVIVVVHGTTNQTAAGALAGAVLAALAIWLLAHRRSASPYRMVLVGIGVAAALQSVVQYLLTRAPLHDAQRAVVWLTGSLNARTWDHVRMVGLALLVLVPVALLLARPLGALRLGHDTATGIGVPTGRAQLGLAFVAVALTAVATAAAGPVNFVALMAAPIARCLTRTAGAELVPAALVGALLVLVADIAGRELFAAELPVGVVTGVIGAPYLLWLLTRANRIGRGG